MSGRRASSRPAEPSPEESRLTRRVEFRRCYERGRRQYGAHCVVYSLENGLKGPRFGITVNRKVGGAVVRNRVKRRLREIYRRWGDRTKLPAVDIVLHARPSAPQASYSQLAQEVEESLARLIGGTGESRSGQALCCC